MHPLVVHFSVVLLLLAAIIFLVAVCVPAVRRRLLGFGVMIAWVAVVTTFIARQSGEALADSVGMPAEHGQWANILSVTCVVFVLAASSWWFVLTRREAQASGLGTILGYVTAVVSVAVIVFSVLTGHSGAQATWGESVTASENAASEKSTAQHTPGMDGQHTYTLSQVQEHSTASDCWTAVDGSVYDLTDWVSEHPGGEGAIERMCGHDATEMFNQQHGSSDGPKKQLAKYEIGVLNS